jgi:hypothetical protein
VSSDVQWERLKRRFFTLTMPPSVPNSQAGIEDVRPAMQGAVFLVYEDAQGHGVVLRSPTLTMADLPSL